MYMYVFMFRWSLPVFFLLARFGRRTGTHKNIRMFYKFFMFFYVFCLEIRPDPVYDRVCITLKYKVRVLSLCTLKQTQQATKKTRQRWWPIPSLRHRCLFATTMRNPPTKLMVMGDLSQPPPPHSPQRYCRPECHQGTYYWIYPPPSRQVQPSERGHLARWDNQEGVWTPWCD